MYINILNFYINKEDLFLILIYSSEENNPENNYLNYLYTYKKRRNNILYII